MVHTTRPSRHFWAPARRGVPYSRSPPINDSAVEEDGFEPPVPRKVDDAFETAIFASGHLPFAGRLIREVRIRFPPPGSILISPDFPPLRRAIRSAAAQDLCQGIGEGLSLGELDDHTFIGEVEALNTTTIRRLTLSPRHQLPAIAQKPGLLCSFLQV